MPLEENCVLIPSFYTRNGKKNNDCCLKMKIFVIYLEIKSKYLTLLEEETCDLTRTITVVRISSPWLRDEFHWDTLVSRQHSRGSVRNAS